MAGRPPAIYIDACLLIAWLTDEDGTEDVIKIGVHDLMKRIEKFEVHLIVSTILKPECKSIREFVDKLFARKSRVTPVDVTNRIANRARDYRETYKLKSPDAIHLATATLFECTHFYTNDAKLLKIGEIDKTKIALPPRPLQEELDFGPKRQA